MAAPTCTGRKAILGLGLKGNHMYDEATIQRNIEEQAAQAREAGFDLEACMFDRTSTPASVAELIRAKLRERQWDGVMLGFGIRGPSDLATTALFETAVNLCAQEMKPTPRFAFNSSPMTTVQAIVRAFTPGLTTGL